MTASDDLVVRLQAAIDEREAVAREAAKYSAEEWTTASSAVLDLGIPDLDGLIPLPASPIGHHMEANDPRAVLRLCQAHRDIVAMYVEAKAQPVRREGREAPLRGLDHASAMGRLTTLGLVIQKLADGYGVTEQT